MTDAVSCVRPQGGFPPGIIEVRLDTPARPVNVLDEPTLRAMADIFARVRDDPTVNGVVITSAKPAHFGAGADLNTIQTATAPADLWPLIDAGQATFAALAELAQVGKPSVAIITGMCLGGAFELALAATWRVATPDHRPTLGLPETTLGLVPGWGGTWRLPATIAANRGSALGAVDAAVTTFDLLCDGTTLTPSAAADRGLIDTLAPPDELIPAAVACLTRPPSLRAVVPSDAPLWPGLDASHLAATLTQRFAARYGPGGVHQVARHAILQALVAGCQRGPAAAQRVERQALSTLAIGPHSRNIQSLWTAQQALRKASRADPALAADLADQTDRISQTLRRALAVTVESLCPTADPTARRDVLMALGAYGFEFAPLAAVFTDAQRAVAASPAAGPWASFPETNIRHPIRDPNAPPDHPAVARILSALLAGVRTALAATPAPLAAYAVDLTDLAATSAVGWPAFRPRLSHLASL